MRLGGGILDNRRPLCQDGRHEHVLRGRHRRLVEKDHGPLQSVRGQDEKLSRFHAGAQLHECEKVRVQRPAADNVPPRWRKLDPPLARQEGPGQEDRGTDLLGEVRGNLFPGNVQCVQPVFVVPDLLNAAPQRPEDLDHHVHILDLGKIPQHDGLVGEERCCQAGKGGVLVPARLDPALQGKPAFDDIVVRGHAAIIEGEGACSSECRVGCAVFTPPGFLTTFDSRFESHFLRDHQGAERC